MALDPRRVEQIVGIFIIALILVTVTMVFMLLRQRDWFTKKFDIRVVFEKGASISEGTPVLMEGIQIGRVKKLRFNAQNQMEGILSLSMRYRHQVRKNSAATVVRPSVLGNAKIDISVGSSDSPLLPSGDVIPGVTTSEPTMQDFLNLANNVVTVMRDLRDPTGPFQRILRNMDEITSRLAQGPGSGSEMLKDDGQMVRDSREVLADLRTMWKGKQSIPITLSEQSQLILHLSEKLDRQADLFTQVVAKLDKISDRLLSKETVAGAVLSDPDFYAGMKDLLGDGRTLLMDMRYLATDLRSVVPQLPGLIDEARGDLKEMRKVLRGLQNMPFIGVKDEPTPKPETMQAPAKIGGWEEKR